MTKTLFMGLLAIIVCTGCMRTGIISRHEAADIARNAAIADGLNLTEYTLEWVSKHTSMIDGRPIWIVYFEGQEQTVGNHFGVVIDAQTRDATLIQGE